MTKTIIKIIINKRIALNILTPFLAQAVGFEPTLGLTRLAVFKTAPLQPTWVHLQVERIFNPFLTLCIYYNIIFLKNQKKIIHRSE